LEKIRINDLARELEVKSKAVIDYLPTIGVNDKKSHSSSLDPDLAERVRKHFAGGDEKPRAKASVSAEPAGIKTKIDLSKISKPGDVLSAIRKQAEPAPAPPKPAAAAKPPAAPAPSAAKPTVVVKPSAATPPAAPPTPAGPAPKTVLPHTGVRPNYAVAPPAPAAPQKPDIQASQEPPAPAAATPQVQVTQPPTRRVIMPQTGARPVYSAPVRPAGAPPAPMGSRSAPGRPVPGQPIFQRPRPASAGGAPGTRPQLRPGERRPMHPTRTSPTGARPGGPRPMGVGPGGGAPPPGRPTARAGAPSRRPGQRYVPRGIKEGPMKGYVPHQQPMVSNEPLPITRTIEISEGISVKELAEKLEIRAKDLIARLLIRGMLATVN